VYKRQKVERVWKGLQKKLSATALHCLTICWLSELPDVDLLLFRYIKKAFNSPSSIELNFGDPDVLEVSKVWRKVSQEKHRMIEFIRFQKAEDGTFFGAMEPLYNVLPLVVGHFKDRFADQKWLIYDLKRAYGCYYDLQEVSEVRFDRMEEHLLSGILNDKLMAEDEKLFQNLWKAYFKAIAIKERINPKLHKQHMPVRFWKYLTEKQG
jgi:probable DNA metabolism protein